nr:Sn2 [Andraca theae]
MRSIILLCAVSVQLVWCSGLPSNSNGVGAFAYQDSNGNRYGGTYGLKDGQVVESNGNFPPNFQVNAFTGFDNFFPEYFRNLDNILQEVFNSNLESQRLAYNAAQKALDLTTNHAGYMPNFNFRYPHDDFIGFGGFPDIPSPFAAMPNFENDFSAFAGAAARPGYTHQVAAINPSNPAMPNINKVNQYTDHAKDGNGYMSVSSSSYSSSSNVNGEQKNQRGAETVVNDNGIVTRYKVEN